MTESERTDLHLALPESFCSSLTFPISDRNVAESVPTVVSSCLHSQRDESLSTTDKTLRAATRKIVTMFNQKRQPPWSFPLKPIQPVPSRRTPQPRLQFTNTFYHKGSSNVPSDSKFCYYNLVFLSSFPSLTGT